MADNSTSLSLSKKEGKNTKKKERKVKKDEYEENLDLEITKEDNGGNGNTPDQNTGQK